MDNPDAIYVKFFDALTEIVLDSQGTWQDQKSYLMSQAAEYGESAETALAEFLAWFDDDDSV